MQVRGTSSTDCSLKRQAKFDYSRSLSSSLAKFFKGLKRPQLTVLDDAAQMYAVECLKFHHGAEMQTQSRASLAEVAVPSPRWSVSRGTEMSVKGTIIHFPPSVSGVTSYVRVSGYPLTCSLNLAFEDESTGPDIFSRSLQAHTNVTSIEADELFGRQNGNGKTDPILPFRVDQVSQLSSLCTQR